MALDPRRIHFLLGDNNVSDNYILHCLSNWFSSGYSFILWIEWIFRYGFTSMYGLSTKCYARRHRFDQAEKQRWNRFKFFRLDLTRCTCLNSSYYYAVNQGGGSLICSLCSTGYVTQSIRFFFNQFHNSFQFQTRSSDGFGCVRSPTTCPSGTETSVLCKFFLNLWRIREIFVFLLLAESDLTGTPFTSTSPNSQPRIGDTSCITCMSGTRANQTSQRFVWWFSQYDDPEWFPSRCAPCASITPRTRNPNDGTIECCTAAQIRVNQN